MIAVRGDAERTGGIALHHEIVEAEPFGQGLWLESGEGAGEIVLEPRRQIPQSIRLWRVHADIEILTHCRRA